MTVVVTILTGGVWREALTDPPVQASVRSPRTAREMDSARSAENSMIFPRGLLLRHGEDDPRLSSICWLQAGQEHFLLTDTLFQ
jgi:hypothetical protein